MQHDTMQFALAVIFQLFFFAKKGVWTNWAIASIGQGGKQNFSVILNIYVNVSWLPTVSPAVIT